MSEQKWYSATKLAKSGLLGYTTVYSITKLVDEGELKAKITGTGRGRKIRISQKWVDEYLDKK